jgi:hypothetical protein
MKRTTKYVAIDVHQATTVASVRQEGGRVIRAQCSTPATPTRIGLPNTYRSAPMRWRAQWRCLTGPGGCRPRKGTRNRHQTVNGSWEAPEAGLEPATRRLTAGCSTS